MFRSPLARRAATEAARALVSVEVDIHQECRDRRQHGDQQEAPTRVGWRPPRPRVTRPGCGGPRPGGGPPRAGEAACPVRRLRGIQKYNEV